MFLSLKIEIRTVNTQLVGLFSLCVLKEKIIIEQVSAIGLMQWSTTSKTYKWLYGGIWSGISSLLLYYLDVEDGLQWGLTA